MSVIVTEINELRQRLKNFDAGKIDTNELTAAVSVYNQTGKRMQLLVKLMALAQKLGGVVDADIMNQMLGSGKIDTSKELEDRTPNRGKMNKPK